MTSSTSAPGWATLAILLGRLIFAGVFIMAVSFKFLDIGGTAGYIASAGFPFALFLTWCTVIFELAIILGFVTGAYFAETCLLAGAYVIFLAFAFHGPDRWEDNQMEFGFFVDHFTFLAGLLFAAAYGPGRILAMRRTIVGHY